MYLIDYFSNLGTMQRVAFHIAVNFAFQGHLEISPVCVERNDGNPVIPANINTGFLKSLNGTVRHIVIFSVNTIDFVTVLLNPGSHYFLCRVGTPVACLLSEHLPAAVPGYGLFKSRAAPYLSRRAQLSLQIDNINFLTAGKSLSHPLDGLHTLSLKVCAHPTGIKVFSGIDGAVNKNNGYGCRFGVCKNSVPAVHVDGGNNDVVNLLVDKALNVRYLLCRIIVGVGKDQIEAVFLTQCLLHGLGVGFTPIRLIRFALGKAHTNQLLGARSVLIHRL